MFISKKSKSSSRRALKVIFSATPKVEEKVKITVEEPKEKPAPKGRKTKASVEAKNEIGPKTEENKQNEEF